VKNGVLLAQPFVTLPVDATGERGLLGVAVDPNFAANGFVYLYYTTLQNGAHNRISRFTASGDVAAGPETVLVDLPLLSGGATHNGGAIHFGLDGKLYVAVGENATPNLAQDPNVPFGKLLRFNADGSIPADNPFASTRTGLARAIFASGLRNPFTFAIQPGTGRIHVNDVGQERWEEINVVAPGANHGWPASEGPDNVTAGVTAPLFTYRHSAASPPGSGPGGFLVGFCIAGGAFYPASGPFPAPYRGSYFFADFVNGFVARLDLANGNAAYTFATGFEFPVDMLVGPDGALYVLMRHGIARITAQ
jgi:glucose/arabinose dehydrogenase